MTVSRACTRLEDRGLVTQVAGVYSNWAGVKITDGGPEYLSVDLVAGSDTYLAVTERLRRSTQSAATAQGG